MSFRLFIYYCALCGGCAAYIGWMLGWMAVGRGSENHLTVDMGVVGMHLGLLVALGLGLVDALWNHSIFQIGQFIMRVAMAVALGGLGGLLGGLIGQGLVSVSPAFRVIGWTITGVLIGASLGAFDVLTGLVRGQELGAGSRKVLKGVVGGTIGGVLGGILYLLLGQAWRSIFHDKPFDQLWSPRATGFVALGLCIGLSIGLAQVILKEAWIKVQKGFRAGRQLIIAKAETTIGRSESCDIGLFGDAGVEPLHARIVQERNRYVLVDADTPGGTFINGERIGHSAPLHSGDVIQVGSSLLVFNERAKRETAVAMA